MKLWLLKYEGWDSEFAIVREETAVAAKRAAGMSSAEVIELSPDGEPEVIWNHEEIGPPSE